MARGAKFNLGLTSKSPKIIPSEKILEKENGEATRGEISAHKTSNHKGSTPLSEAPTHPLKMDQPKIEGLDKIEGSHVKMKGNIMLKGRPCQVTKVSFAKPGKHGK